MIKSIHIIIGEDDNDNRIDLTLTLDEALQLKQDLDSIIETAPWPLPQDITPLPTFTS